MNWLTQAINSSLGRKLLVGLTGCMLLAFIAGHLAGNLLLFIGADAYNAYARALHSNPFLPVVEVALLLSFLIHGYLVITLYFSNKAARGAKGYAVVATKREETTWPSNNMLVTGAVVLGFIVLHLCQLRFNLWGAKPDLHTEAAVVIKNAFSDWKFIIAYMIGGLAVGLHLQHGFHSAFRTLGAAHPKYTPILEKLGTVFALVAAFGFASLPLFVKLIR